MKETTTTTTLKNYIWNIFVSDLYLLHLFPINLYYSLYYYHLIIIKNKILSFYLCIIETFLVKIKDKWVNNKYYSYYLYYYNIYNYITSLRSSTLFFYSFFLVIKPSLFFTLFFLDYLLVFKYNISIFMALKYYKNLLSIVLGFYSAISILYLNYLDNLFFSLGLILLILTLIYIKIYINYIDKAFKDKYPVFYSLLDWSTTFFLLFIIPGLIVWMLPHNNGGPSFPGPGQGPGQGPGPGNNGGGMPPNKYDNLPINRRKRETEDQRKARKYGLPGEWTFERYRKIEIECYRIERLIESRVNWLNSDEVQRNINNYNFEAKARTVEAVRDLIASETSDSKIFPTTHDCIVGISRDEMYLFDKNRNRLGTWKEPLAVEKTYDLNIDRSNNQ